MAWFDYHCDKCEKQFEIQCGMNDDRDNIKCPDCECVARRIFTSILIPKKGGGTAPRPKSNCSSCSSRNCSTC